MRESIGNAYLLGIIAFFVVIIMLFFSASMNYTRAFKVKNRIINIIETNKTYNNGEVKTEIDRTLGDMKYRIANNASCKQEGRFENAKLVNQTIGTSTYRYCIYEFNSKDRGKYYGVVTYMYFDIPLLNVTLEFPIYGETKTLGVY